MAILGSNVFLSNNGFQQGPSQKILEIAAELVLSTRTVDMQVGNILNRLDCRTRAEAVRKAGERGLLD